MADYSAFQGTVVQLDGSAQARAQKGVEAMARVLVGQTGGESQEVFLRRGALRGMTLWKEHAAAAAVAVAAAELVWAGCLRPQCFCHC